MADFDIKVLLAQAKNDPRFQNITTNGLRMGSTALSNDPIVSGVDGGNAPLLFNVASNTAGLFDVVLDIFIVLKEEITNTVTFTDVLTRVQSKNLLSFLNIKDIFETNFSTLKQESIEAISRFTLEQEKAIADIFKISDNVDDISAGRNYKEIINAIDYVAKHQKLIMHRGVGGITRFPLADIAIAMAHPISQGGANHLQQGLKPSAAFGSGYTSNNWPLETSKWNDWEYQYKSNGTFSSSGPFGNQFYYFGPYFCPTNSPFWYTDSPQGNTLTPIWSDFTNDWYDWDKYMPEIKSLLQYAPYNNLTGSYVYWWMPGYYKTFAPITITTGNQTWNGPSVFAASPLEYSKDTGTPLADINLGTIKFMQIFDSGNPNLAKFAGMPRQTGGQAFTINLNNPLRTFTKENNTVLANTENARIEDFKGGQLVKIVSEIKEIKKRSFQKPKELLNILSKTLVPKGKVLPLEKIDFEEKINFAQFITLKPQAFKVEDEKHPNKIGKGLLELVLEKEHVLTPKITLLLTRFFSSDRQKLKITTALSSQKVSLLDKHNKDIGVGKRSENIESFSHLIDSPAETIIKGERVAISTEKQKKATRLLSNNVNLFDIEFFNMNRALFEIFDLKDFVVTPVKSKVESERVLLQTTKAKDTTKPLLNEIDFSHRQTFDSIKSLFTDNGVFRINTVNPTKALPVESDRVLLKSFIDILREFELIDKTILDAGIIEKDIEKIIHHSSKSNAKDVRLVTANSLLHGEVIGIVSKDRDAGGSGDVFFTFRPAFRKDKVFIDDEEVVKNVNKPLSNDSVATKQVLLQKTRAKIKADKALINDVLFAFNMGKGINGDRITVKDEEVIKDVEKPLKTVGDLKDLFLTAPASITIKRSTFTTNDDFNPWVMNKIIHELGLTALDLVRKKYLPRRSIDNSIQVSEKGVAFIRDEEYTKGPYFLQPYVAAIPPGRSRQF